MPDVMTRILRADDLDPELAAIARPMRRQLQVAALRVAAHDAHPRIFALPADPDSLEAALAPAFGVLKRRAEAGGAGSRIEPIAQRAAAQLQEPKRQRKLGIDVAAHDLTDAMDNLALKAPRHNEASLLRLVDRHYDILGLRRITTGAISPYSAVRLDLVRVVCIDETNGFLGSEAGDDEFYMSATSIDESGNTDLQLKPFKVGDFSDGDRKDFVPEKRLLTFDVGGGRSYPKHYFATMLATEHDNGDLDEEYKKIFDKIVAMVRAKLVEYGVELGTSVGGPLGTVVGALAGWLAGYLMDELADILVKAWEDDPFNPVTLEFIIPDETSRITRPSEVFHYRGPGEYAVRYRWSTRARPAEDVITQ